MDGKRIKEAAGDFPATVFPEKIADIAMDSYMDACFPMSYSLSSMLLAICVAIGTSRTLKWRQRVFQCNLFMAIVGKAGAVKSHPVDSAMSPLRERDSITLREYAASLRDYREGRTHEKPVPHQYVTNDVTTEGLAKILLNNPGGVCVHNDELNGLFKSFDRYHQGGGDVEKWLSFFDGKALTVNRKSTDDIINIVQPFVSFIGTIQPAVLIKTFTSELIENGMFPRILYVSNSSADKPVLWNSEEDLPSTREDDWRNFISRVIDQTGQTMEYTMNQKAIETICTWRNIIENGLFDDGDEERLLIFRKIQVYALRFCIPMKVMWEIAENREATTEVTQDDVCRAIGLASYFYKTACDTYDMICSRGFDEEAGKFASMLEDLPVFFRTENVLAIGAARGMSRATVYRNLNKAARFNFIRRRGHGEYEKLL